jgi:putative toxin-antitoxin system antitoxin component (TIGR02293 family)
LQTPQPGLADVHPVDLLKTEAGAREVEDLLERIEYGVVV